MKLHIDIETFSSVDIKTAGAYKYIESFDFEILMVAYAFEGDPINIVDLAAGEKLPERFINALKAKSVTKCAHNAVFERTAFKAIGYDVPVEQWKCTAIKAAYCGLPLSLGEVSKALDMGDKAKSATGKALINYFSCPVKPTKVNGGRTRNLPQHNPEKWQQFKDYCVQDVEAERYIDVFLSRYEIPKLERKVYELDQEINDRGIMVDLELAKNAFNINEKYSKELFCRLVKLTGLENPNSPVQLKAWLSSQLGREINSLTKDATKELLTDATGEVKEVLEIRQQSSKTSIKKYTAMLNCTCDDNRAHGLFQFYGANRTGRWAGRLVQLQNLPQNHLRDLENDRENVRSNDYDLCKMVYENIPSVLSQLIRTAFVAKKDHIFAVADFSAIEARVIAWLADEVWRINVFKTHGKIYEASAAMMFGIPLEQITKDLRQKGKIAELALGYGGSVGALTQMGGEAMGLSESEMKTIVDKWRAANQKITSLWRTIENCAKKAVRLRMTVRGPHNLLFVCDEMNLRIKLPSGRELFYNRPGFTTNKFGSESIRYKGVDQTKKIWTYLETYGGKLVENIVQAIARDLLAESMLRLKKADYPIVMHVHDEAVAEIMGGGDFENDVNLKTMCEIMGEPVKWAPGLPLKAEGYITPFYKKD